MLEIIRQILGPAGIVFAIAAIVLFSGVKILKEYQRAVIFRLGRLVASRGPGITYVIPWIEKMVRVELRTVTLDVPPQDVITRDNVSVKVSAVLISESWIRPARFVKSRTICLPRRSRSSDLTQRLRPGRTR